MNTPQNQDQQDVSLSNKDIDVTRSQNREGAAPGNTAETQMGTASEDTGARRSNDDKDNHQQNVRLENTGSHGEGQYPRNTVNPAEGEGLVGKPGDKPE